MEEFFEVFSLCLISLFIINLFSSMYPLTENKKTLVVILSIIGIYICITPIGTLFSSLNNMSDFSLDAVCEDFSKDSSKDTYTELIETAIEDEIKNEIECRFKSTKTFVDVGIVKNDSVNEMKVLEITVDEFNLSDDEKGDFIEYIENTYGVSPNFKTSLS